MMHTIIMILFLTFSALQAAQAAQPEHNVAHLRQDCMLKIISTAAKIPYIQAEVDAEKTAIDQKYKPLLFTNTMAVCTGPPACLIITFLLQAVAEKICSKFIHASNPVTNIIARGTVPAIIAGFGAYKDFDTIVSYAQAYLPAHAETIHKHPVTTRALIALTTMGLIGTASYALSTRHTAQDKVARMVCNILLPGYVTVKCLRWTTSELEKCKKESEEEKRCAQMKIDHQKQKLAYLKEELAVLQSDKMLLQKLSTL